MGLDEDQQKIVSNLKKKRGVVKASLTRVRTFITKFNPREDAITLLEFRQEELPQINRKFDEIQCQIELVDVENDEEAECEREKFEREYYSIRSEIQEIINLEKSHNTSIQNNSSINSVSALRAQLAPIELPKFNGDILEWESFFDCYKVLVHNEEMYSPAQKFSYLRSTLIGQALDVVKGIPMTDINYGIAIRKLQERYDNKNLVIQSHIRSILDILPMVPGSSRGLQDIHSRISTHIAALETLGQPVEYWDAWLITIVLRKLDQATIQAWQSRCTNTDLPKYTDLEKFLAGRCIAFQSTEAWSHSKESNGEGSYQKATIEKKSNVTSNTKRALITSKYTTEDKIDKCPCCFQIHKIYSCKRFKELPQRERLDMVRAARLCFNCLSPFHMATTCQSNSVCTHCKGKHNSLLHFNKTDKPETRKQNDIEVLSDQQLSSSSSSSSQQPQVHSCIAAKSINTHVFLSTAMVLITDKHGRKRQCRAVLDSGSMVNFISKSLLKTLQLPTKSAELPVRGIGASRVQAVAMVELEINSKIKRYESTLSCYVLPTVVSELPSCATPKEGWNIPKALLAELADPKFYEAGSVDLLIGAGTFYELIESERLPLTVGNLALQATRLGWVMTGEIGVNCMMSIGVALQADLGPKKLLDESFGSSSKNNKRCLEEQITINHFKENTVRNHDGRFVVRLPIKSSVNELGNSHAMATSRFLSIERKLQQDDVLKEQYIKFMSEYIELGHMREVKKDWVNAKQVWYLPHHAIVKSTSLTTKVRVVFDASAKGSNRLSLNDVLTYGPTIQEDVFSILLRFRKHQYVLTADVEKMFRQISVDKQDWDLQRVFWRANPSDPLITYHLTTVTYGTTPASFIATQCLAELAKENKNQYPKAAQAIQNDFYMDDLMSGSDTEEECCKLQKDINTIMNSAKLPLRKWCSNSSMVLSQIGKHDDDPLFTLELTDGETIKSLGLEWQPFNDQFQFTINKIPARNNYTKRTLLSDLNRIFDPLGFVSPVLLRGKIFLQQIWSMQLDWDSTLSLELQERWESFYSDLEKLKNVTITRKVSEIANNDTEIHGFSDASQEAYGACLYLRSRDQKGKWNSRLLCSKTRVAPLKGSTIPRLELSGALLLVELADKMAASWKVDIRTFRFWTDSTIVLGWLNSQGSRLKTFVANRVSQILELTSTEQWNHVRTEDNPADLASRGLHSSELPNAVIWWNGPQWLQNEQDDWISSFIPSNENDLPEQRKIKLVLLATKPSIDLINHYSSWNRLIRAVGWIMRFIEYIRSGKKKQTVKYLTVQILRDAELIIVKRAQEEVFSKEIIALQQFKEVSRRSSLKALNPSLKNTLLVVGGRLENATIPEEQKRPIILPYDHRVTRLIFMERHRTLLHCGPLALLADVRRQYWPLRGRIIARSIVKHCVDCVRAKPTFEFPMMAPLPKERVICNRPFTNTGVDFAGPITIRSGIRGRPGRKAWVAIFVCFTTKATHIEVVEELTSSAFIAALRRFSARRGKPSAIWSDNGTNFVGAQRELSVYTKNIETKLANEGINWHFNPPASPHFGGLWESCVKSAKHHLIRVTKQAMLTLSELQTLLCQIEACLNSRPLTPLSSDPDDLEPLTPAHFLIGGPITLPPEPNLTTENLTGLHRWRLVQGILQTFWNRWRNEYLPQLQIRGKWRSGSKLLKINDIVIVKEDNVAPTKWRMAIVTNLHPGRDGHVRVVTIRMANGTETKRPVIKLCPLPVTEEPILVVN